MTQLTIIDQVKDIESKSGVAFEIDVTELANLADRGKAIKSVDDPNFAPVKREFQQKRKYVKEYMMDARSEFNRLAKGVIEVEKMILSEITPEEDRLIALDKAEKERKLKEERLEALPAKRERVTAAGIEFTDEEVLELSDADFEIEYNRRLGEKLEAERVADQERRDAEQAKIDAEKEAAEAKIREAELATYNSRVQQLLTLGMKDEGTAYTIPDPKNPEHKLYNFGKTALREFNGDWNKQIDQLTEIMTDANKEREDIESTRIAQEKKDAAEQAVKEDRERAAEKARVEEEAAAKAEADRLANEKFQSFLKENNYNEETDLLIEGNKIYRLVAEFKTE